MVDPALIRSRNYPISLRALDSCNLVQRLLYWKSNTTVIQEAAMKKALKENYLNTLILVVITTGTAFAAFIGDISRGVEPLQTIFFCFVGAIFAIQVVPALLLVGGLVKGLLSRPEKELAEEKLHH
jgi:hypothetical protein